MFAAKELESSALYLMLDTVFKIARLISCSSFRELEFMFRVGESNCVKSLLLLVKITLNVAEHIFATLIHCSIRIAHCNLGGKES